MPPKAPKRGQGTGENLIDQKQEVLALTDPETAAVQEKMEKTRAALVRLDSDILHNGGTNCGWDAGDHEDFLKLRTLHKNKTSTIAFFNDVLSRIPNIDQEGVQSHVQAYVAFLDMTEKKKDLLKEYKELKQEEHRIKMKRIDEASLGGPRDDTSLFQGSSRSVGKENVEEVKAQLEKWKRDKQEKKRSKDEEERLEKEMALERRRRQEEEQQAKRAQVAEYRAIKELDKERDKALQEMEKKRKKRLLSANDKARISAREEELFRKKHEHINAKVFEKEDHDVKIKLAGQSIANKYAKVESRVNEETKTAQGKKREKFDSKRDSGKDALTFGGQLIGTGLRQQASWRRGI